MTKKFVNAIEVLSKLAGEAAAMFLLIILALMLVEIVLRSFFNQPLGYSWEWATYLMAASFFLGSAYTLHVGVHVRVSVLLQTTGPAFGRWVDAVSNIVALVIVIYVSSSLTDLTFVSFVRDVRSFTPTRTALWIPQSVVALGSWLLALQLTARFIRLLNREATEFPLFKLEKDVS